MKKFSQLVEDISQKNQIANLNYHADAVFITGGPGSGKDVVVRECIIEYDATELNLIQAMDCLNDKHILAKKTGNVRQESIRIRKNLVINGPADDIFRITAIKEELEELGYCTKMIFVNTSDAVSKKRNSTLRRMMTESIRKDKWTKSQNHKIIFSEIFSDFTIYENSKDNSNLFTSLYESTISPKAIQKINLLNKGCGRHGKLLFDDNCPFCQDQSTKGKIDDIRYNDIKTGKTFTYGKYAESKEPTLVKATEPKIAKFNMDKDRMSIIKRGDKSLMAPRAARPDGVGATYNSRMGGGGSSAGAGLGNQTYSESRTGLIEYNNSDVSNFSSQPNNAIPKLIKEKKTLKKFRETIEVGGEMGVGGVLGGSSNKEPMITPMDKYNQSGITIKKKKIGAN